MSTPLARLVARAGLHDTSGVPTPAGEGRSLSRTRRSHPAVAVSPPKAERLLGGVIHPWLETPPSHLAHRREEYRETRGPVS